MIEHQSGQGRIINVIARIRNRMEFSQEFTGPFHKRKHILFYKFTTSPAHAVRQRPGLMSQGGLVDCLETKPYH